ncbi:MAG: DUF2341 domain-containing protein, partial [Promethearchaeota archaeon]
MIVYRKRFKRFKNRTKSIGFLLVLIILPLIFNALFFTIYNKNIDKGYTEKFPDEENPITSSNHPNNADDYEYYKTLTIDHTQISGTENLVDFPVLISLFDADLHDNTQADGDDIAFSNGFQWLDHEIELFNQTYNSTHAQLIAWVRIPVLFTSIDTIIRMYYGNPFMEAQQDYGVWNNGYAAVWHLREFGTGVFGEFKDSSSNDNNGRGGGGFPSYVPTQISGKIGYAQEFDGTDDFINIVSSSSLRITGTSVTVEAWVQLQEDLAPQWGTGIVGKGDSYKLFQDWDGNRKFSFSVETSSQVWVSDSNKQLTTWYHVVGVYDGSSATIFVDGNVVLSSPHSGSITGNFDPVRIGLDDQEFDGLIDEVRISNVVRSADWIKTEYTNQNDPDNFYSVSGANNVNVPSIFDFQYFKEITIDHTQVVGTTDHINFPILLSIYDSDLHDNVQPDGDDIAFNNGTAWLHHEIEFFDQNYNSTHARLAAWVCIPILSPSVDTIIRMYYGNTTMSAQENPQGVWKSNYVGVWHLGESGGDALDSTLFKTNGTLIGGVTQRASGQISYAYDFDGVNGRVSFGDPPDGHLDHGTSSFTYSIWVHIDQTTGTYQIPFYKGGSSAFSRGYDFETYSDGSYINSWISDGSTYENSAPAAVAFGDWMYLVAVIDRAQNLQRFYRDGSPAGVPVDISSFGSVDTTIQFELSRSSYEVDGIIDEVRISRNAHSYSWIATEYANQKDPSAFYMIGTQIEVNNDAPSDAFFFTNYKYIRIDHALVVGSGYHSNFPLLISMTDTDLHSDVQADGDDIAFSLGSTWLDHEIELFNKNYNGTHAELVVWVRIPQLSTSLDTYIRMYYGNATMSACQNPVGVWDTSYKGVWHLEESSGFTLDSTSYNENGLVTGSVIRPSTGQISNAYNYGIDGTFNVGDPADGHLDFGTDSFMVSMWINIDTSTGTSQIPLYKGSSSTWDQGYCFA